MCRRSPRSETSPWSRSGRLQAPDGRRRWSLLVFGAFNLTAGWRGGSDTEDLPIAGMGAVLLIIAAIVLGPVARRPVRASHGRRSSPVGARPRRDSPWRTRPAARSAPRPPRRRCIIGGGAGRVHHGVRGSAKASVTETVSRGFKGDFVVQAGGGFAGGVDRSRPPSPMRWRRSRACKPRWASASAAPSSRFPEGGKTIGPVPVGDRPVPARRACSTPRWPRAEVGDLTDDGVIVDVGEATDHGLEVGDTITILFSGGKTTKVTVEGISDEEKLLAATTRSPGRRSSEHVPTPTDFIGVRRRSTTGADVDTVMAAIDKVIDESPTLEVVDQDGFIGNIADQITQFVTIIYVLLALSVIIAPIGIANTLSLAIHERTRELGLLRAVGMNRSQLRASIRWEADADLRPRHRRRPRPRRRDQPSDAWRRCSSSGPDRVPHAGRHPRLPDGRGRRARGARLLLPARRAAGLAILDAIAKS